MQTFRKIAFLNWLWILLTDSQQNYTKVGFNQTFARSLGSLALKWFPNKSILSCILIFR